MNWKRTRKGTIKYERTKNPFSISDVRRICFKVITQPKYYRPTFDEIEIVAEIMYKLAIYLEYEWLQILFYGNAKEAYRFIRACADALARIVELTISEGYSGIDADCAGQTTFSILGKRPIPRSGEDIESGG